MLKPQAGLTALVFLLLTSQVLARENLELKIVKSPCCPCICGSGEQSSPGYITEIIQYILTQQDCRIEYIELNFARGIQLDSNASLISPQSQPLPGTLPLNSSALSTKE